jgi:hypothetical protein
MPKTTKTKTVPGDPVDAVYGILSLDISTDEAIRVLRGEPHDTPIVPVGTGESRE